MKAINKVPRSILNYSFLFSMLLLSYAGNSKSIDTLVIPFTYSNGPDIVEIEYFFDSDPGPNAGTTVSVSPSNNVNHSFSVDASNLSYGGHFLLLRAKDSDGKWTRTVQQQVITSLDTFMSPYPPANHDIVALEYFIDDDPGQSMATEVPISTGLDVNKSFTVDFSAEDYGAHFLHVRAQDINGKWTALHAGQVIKDPSQVIDDYSGAAAVITKIEFFFNSDPGQGEGNDFSFAADVDVQIIDGNSCTFGLDSGSHVIQVRAQNAFGQWSSIQSDTFHVFGPCTATLQIDDNPIAQGTYEDCNIESGGRIPASVFVTYDAGNEILLKPEFEVELGSDFTAKIKRCSNESPPIPD